MPSLVIVGAQWGDEAKGKMVDVLGGDASYVVRWSGGNNAGHTVIIGDQTFKFQLIPAGILHPGTVSIIGGGMLVCPKHLIEEIDRTREQRAELGELIVSPAAHVVFPFHRLLDALEEEARGENKIGTTSRGIGPAYTDKVSRIGIRMGEFVDPDIFAKRLRDVLAVKNRLLRMFEHEEIEFDALHAEYAAYAEKIRPYVKDAESRLFSAYQAGERILFEGAQGTFLDLDHGTYPYVTSSHPIAGGACLGTGLGPRHIDRVLGVAKAYTTRVGEGPFPTELNDSIGQAIRDAGHEYGTVTGRPRRCGWLDLVALRHSAAINSLSGWVMTRLDVLSGLEEIRVATAYKLPSGETKSLPGSMAEWAQAEPVYRTFKGWSGNLRPCRQWDELPAEARTFLEFVAEETGVPIAVVSVGPDRAETIIVRPDALWG